MDTKVERQIGGYAYAPTAAELAAEQLCLSLRTELEPAASNEHILQEWPHIVRYSPWGVFRDQTMIRVEYYRQPPKTDYMEWKQSHLLHGDGDWQQPPEIREIMESAQARKAILLDPASYPPSIERLPELLVADIFDVSGNDLTHQQIRALSGDAYIKFRGDRRVLKVVYDRPAILHRPVKGLSEAEYDRGYKLDTLRVIDLRVVAHQDHGLDHDKVLPEHWVGQMVESESRTLGIPLIGMEYRFPAEVAPGQMTNLMASLLEDYITRLNAA